MGKKEINIQGILLFLFVFITMRSYSQEFFTKELKWGSVDSITVPDFQDTNQIVEWGKSISPLVSVQSEKIHIKNSNVFVLMVDKCSGVYCPTIYVFNIRNKIWQFNTSSNAKLKEQIKIEVDNKLEKVIFKTKSSQIGELPFETLNLRLDKTEQ